MSEMQTQQKNSQVQQALNWRMDPSESLSDWTLQIFNRSTKTFQIYHVHRVALAVGPRACGYFHDAFSSSNKNNRNHVTRIPLIAQACRLIPLFLDYVYSQPSFLLHTNTAVGLAYLADYFGQPKLLAQVETFVSQDLKRDTLHRYYVDSVYYDQHRFLDDLVVNVCSKELPNMTWSSASALLDELSCDYLVQILEKISTSSMENSYDWSTLVAGYCLIHQPELTLTVFEQLTSRLTALDASTAMELLTLELAILEEEEEEEKLLREQYDGEDDSSSLQKRCIQVLAEDWETVCEIDPASVTLLLESLSRRRRKCPLLVDWFQETLTKAHQQVHKMREELNASSDREAFLKKDLHQLVEERNQAIKEVQTQRNHFSSTKTEMKEQISGWVRKHGHEALEWRAEEQKWDQERLLWRMERQQWYAEREEFERQLLSARRELDRLPGRKCPKTSYLDTTCSYISEDDWIGS
jgi:hypothetical protein